jgi:HD-like signal output (HDOD) protein
MVWCKFDNNEGFVMFRWLRQLISGVAAGAPGGRLAEPTVPQPAPVSTPASAAPVSVPARATGPTRPVTFEQFDRVNIAFHSWLFGREGDDGLETTPLEDQVLAALAAIQASQQSGAALVRRMPGLIPQLLQSLRSDSFSGAALSRTISADVVLVAAVVRLANSALEGTGAAIGSVENAVIVIGQDGLRQLITSVAFRPIIDTHSGYYTRTLAPRMWEHAERCAVANRKAAADLGIDPFEAFLAGLVQHAGLIVALRIMDQVAKGDTSLGSELFWAYLVRTARKLACSIGREWNFPVSITQALSEQDGMRKGIQLSPLGQLLILTDYLGKTRMLVEQKRLDEADTAVFWGLPPHAQLCYAALRAPAQ